ncbi:MAG: transposase family protein, partial [Prevotellaceae bacterium]|nr:transposase family protein [Prevotellaceae bacterium]
MENPLSYFSDLTAPRVVRTREHSLEDLLFIAIASIISSAETWYDMEEFGKAKEEWLKASLPTMKKIVFEKCDLKHESRKVEIWEEKAKAKESVVLLTNNMDFPVED